jgi:kynurenine/2-aminoadipate aminotransferase
MFRSLRLGVRNPLIMARSASSSSNGPSGGLLSSYERFLTARSIARQPSPIRALQPFIGLPGMISLGGGMPNPSTFPFSNLSVTTTDGETLNFSGKELDQALQYSESVRNCYVERHLLL